MARPLRLQFPGSISHITARGNEKRNTFRDDSDRERFLILLAEAVRRFDWLLYAYALMSNHFHLVIELTRETLSDGMHWLNGEYARWFNRRHDRVGHLFQSRYGSVLVDRESYLKEVLRYVVLNPVRAQIVNHPADYEWTSYRAAVGEIAAPEWLAVKRSLEIFAPDPDPAREEYRRFTLAGIGCARRPWDDTVGQIYLGSDSWIQALQTRIQEKPRSSEHPKVQRNPLKPNMTDVVRAVARTLGVPEHSVQNGRGGTPRMVAAWLGRYRASSDLRSIATALNLRSASGAAVLISNFERVVTSDATMRKLAEDCTDALSEQ